MPTHPKNSAVKLQGIRVQPIEGSVQEHPYRDTKARGGYSHGSRIQTFDRQTATAPVRNFAFSGKGFLPDFFTVHAPANFHEASATRIENEGVHGREGMMPVAGTMLRLQNGQNLDEGSGGAGSFATVPARDAKMNG